MPQLVALLLILAAIAFLTMLFLGNVGILVSYLNVALGIFVFKVLYAFITLER